MPETTHPEKFYLTTPIYYVNARPHIGHAYSTIVADVLARRHRLLGHDTYFLTGTDEHGQKIERSAAAAGIPPQQFADQVSKTFSDLWQRMGITNDDFIRTTEPRHKRGVQELFRTLYERGHIYLSTYTGQYSIGEEMFVDGPPGTIGPDGRPTETVTEENFFFRLSAFQGQLSELIESDTLKITPESSKNEVLSFVRGGLKDLSVSRSSFTWGIPVPEEMQREAGATQKHVVYVWLDALANYMTAVGYGDPAKADLFAKWWPADLHLVGKEITRFHCVYWPAFLLALDPGAAVEAGREQEQVPFGNDSQKNNGDNQTWVTKWLPKQVTANGWLLFDNSKMSKSKGNVVRTETILDGFGDHVYGKQFPESSKEERDLFASDVLRYFLLREIPFGQDGSFSFEAMVTRYNADLANGYANLVNRTLTIVNSSFGGSFSQELGEQANRGLHLADETPNFTVTRSSIDKALLLYEGMTTLFDFATTLTNISACITSIDRYFSSETPWKLAKSQLHSDRVVLARVLCLTCDSIRIVTALLYPFIPASAARGWAQLGLGNIDLAAESGKLANLNWGGFEPGIKIAPLSAILPRADKSLVEVMMEMEVVTPHIAKSAMGGAPGSFVGEERVMPIDDTSQVVADPKTHPAAPLKGASTPGPIAEVVGDSTHPAAPPRTSSLETENAGGHVAGSAAVTTERVGTPPHGEAAASGIFSATADTAQIGIEDFAKVDLRVAKILVAERIPKADKLLRLEVDIGYEQRQILSGIAEWYQPEELIGRKIVIIANLAPRKMRGLESRGMLLAASEGEGGKPILATFGEDIAIGTRLR